ncbi:leucine--tRNA ligase [Caldimonas sp. KR1-144]|uniref:leucine--tRNA ligase n=1 Tax=Caldimonas sp. KR1-144 TaxID=3400911 RepID=UPI003C027F30
MNDKYAPSEVEAAAQAHWNAIDAYRVREDAAKPKFYACSMLPYPSGKLHMGHVRNYTINDMMARYLRMKGRNVLMPMGWDAFGLPAENAAIDKKVAPAKWTRDNIADMKSQMQPLGLAFDWSREVATCDASYYKWNQWFFLKMLEKGIAYKKTQVVNWDPVDQTVLANEQVIDGRGWRSGAIVEKREIPGYYLAITQYADELLANVADPAAPGYLHGWPERVRLMQENWIGKSEGVRFAFTHDIRDANGALIQDGRMYVFTTRADTIMGVTFCAVAPEHPLAQHAAASNPALAEFIEACKAGGTTEAELATKEKEGRPTGLHVTHPITGQQVEVWVGNYVLMSYGDGAVMGVPGHDERDFAFALKYGLPIMQVVHVDGEHYDYTRWQEWYADKQRGVTINSDNYSGLHYQDAVDAIAKALAAKGLGEKKTTWRLRDWGISRQRYWGTPIPIIHCDDCGSVPVPEKDLPVVLPEELIPDGSGNPLSKCASFLNVGCPQCGKPAQRETDTMDTFVDSAWYYMRYCCPDSEGAMVDARNDYWMPMDQYIGGIEHAVLHLLYARFWTKAMRDLGLVKFDEPFTRLFTQGMLLNECYFREDASGKKRWFYPSEVEVQFDDKGHPVGATAKEDGQPVSLGGIEKMSKSKNNVVEPKDIIAKFGADTARLFTMFAGPPDQSAAWSDSGAEGSFRYLRRLWAFAVKQREAIASAGTSFDGLSANAAALRREVHSLLRQIGHDYDRLQYNTVVSGAMKLLNALEGAQLADTPADRAALREGMGILLRALYPAAPHIAHALWQQLGYARELGDLIDAPWPAIDESALVQDEIELVLQVNGKLRGSLKVPANADKAAIEAAALASAEVAKFAEGRPPKKVVVVPGRLVNVVA